MSLKVHSPKDIEKLSLFLENNKKYLNIPFAFFKEPEINNSMTAISLVAPKELCLPIQKEVNYLFSEISKLIPINSFIDLKDRNPQLELYKNILLMDKNIIQLNKEIDLIEKEIFFKINFITFNENDERQENSIFLNLAQLEFYRTVRQFKLA